MAHAAQRDDFPAVYLHQLQTLAFEMNVAMGAIAGNAIDTLEDSIARQEMLCASLARMATVVQQQLQMPAQPTLQLDDAIAARIQAAGSAIHTLNLQYAALLRHSGKSIALLASLCKTHTGQFQEARGPRLKQQTWSCEM